MAAVSAPPPQPVSGHGFQKALEQFKRDHVKGNEEEIFRLTDLGSLKSSLRTIQDEQASKRKMRNMARLRGFLEGMEQYEELVKVFLNTSELLAFVWGPIKFLLQITKNHVKAFDALLEKYEDIGEQLEALKQYQGFLESKDYPLLKKVLEMIYDDILDFHAKALSYFRQKRWRTFFDAVWNNFQTRFSEPIGNLKRHRRLLESHVSSILLEETAAMHNKQAESLKLQRDEAKRQQRKRVCNWLAHEDMMADQEHLIGLRKAYMGTGTWVLKRNPIQAWLDPGTRSDPVVRLTGIPGAGKTMLASVIIEQAMKTPDASVIFFYCKDGNRNRNNFLAVARNLLYQLSVRNDRLTEYLDAVMAKEGQTTLERPELAKQLLTAAVRNENNLFIVIDGLDECLAPEKKNIISWVQSVVLNPSSGASPDDEDDDNDDIDLTGSGASFLKCLLVSQEDGECTRYLKGYPTLKIQSADNEEDIKAFCEHWESRIRAKHPRMGFEDGPGSIATSVLGRADGMFLFAKLVMANLHAQTRPYKLQEELEWLRNDSQKQGIVGRLGEV